MEKKANRQNGQNTGSNAYVFPGNNRPLYDDQAMDDSLRASKSKRQRRQGDSPRRPKTHLAGEGVYAPTYAPDFTYVPDDGPDRYEDAHPRTKMYIPSRNEKVPQSSIDPGKIQAEQKKNKRGNVTVVRQNDESVSRFKGTGKYQKRNNVQRNDAEQTMRKPYRGKADEVDVHTSQYKSYKEVPNAKGVRRTPNKPRKAPDNDVKPKLTPRKPYKNSTDEYTERRSNTVKFPGNNRSDARNTSAQGRADKLSGGTQYHETGRASRTEAENRSGTDRKAKGAPNKRYEPVTHGRTETDSQKVYKPFKDSAADTDVRTKKTRVYERGADTRLKSPVDKKKKRARPAAPDDIRMTHSAREAEKRTAERHEYKPVKPAKRKKERTTVSKTISLHFPALFGMPFWVNILLVFVLAGVALTGLVLYPKVKNALFKVTSVRVSGNTAYSKKAIIADSKINKGMSLSSVDVKNAEKCIEITNPYIDATVSKNILGTVTIYVSDRTAYAAVDCGEKYLLVDEEFRALEFLGKDDDRVKELVVLHGMGTENYKLAELIGDESTDSHLHAAKIIMNAIQEAGVSFTVTDVDLLNCNEIVCLISENMYIKLGNTENATEKLRSADELIPSLRSSGLGNGGILDVSVDGRYLRSDEEIRQLSGNADTPSAGSDSAGSGD